MKCCKCDATDFDDNEARLVEITIGCGLLAVLCLECRKNTHDFTFTQKQLTRFQY